MKKQKCDRCGICCRLFLVNLTEKEYISERYKTVFDDDFIEDFQLAKKFGANILAQKKDGSCIYLKDNICSIHSTRPLSCRDFFCNSKKERFKDMVKEINEFKKT